MSSRVGRCLSWLALVALLPQRSQACGPDFPSSVLRSRHTVLLQVRNADLDLEAKRYDWMGPLPTCAPDHPWDSTAMPVRTDLPDGARYQAGAIAFRAKDMATAMHHFRTVLDLPAEQRRAYSVAAAYMLGRLSAPHGHAWFAKVRELAAQGYQDPLCLSADSWGQDGRQHLQSGDDAAAVRDYLAEARVSGFTLRTVASHAASNPARLRKAVQDPVLRHWVSAWFAAGHGTREQILVLADLPTFDGADALAAAAWREGDFALAERLAPRSNSALGQWMQAKVAMRHGHSDRARALMADAELAAEESKDARLLEAVRQDAASLALGQADYLETGRIAAQLRDAGLLAYVAERMLDPDAALALTKDPRVRAAWGPEPTLLEPAWTAWLFVPSPAPLPVESFPGSACTACVWTSSASKPWLDAVVGRRLMREGRWREAVPLLPRDEQPRARAYGTALDRAAQWTGIDKAKALYDAAMALHPDGMPLTGTELEPDWAFVEGSYDDGLAPVYRQHLWGDGDEPLPVVAPVAEGCALYLGEVTQTMDEPGPCLETVDERLRYQRHGPHVQHTDAVQRFHYRLVKSELLEQAADLVPSHTQAFAALLCEASVPIASRNWDRVRALRRRYLRDGADVPNTWYAFGEGPCAVPQFELATTQALLSWPYRVRRAVRRQVWHWRNAWETWWQPPEEPAQVEPSP